ncbi:hypothetical protein [Nocardia flavorosea]|uniref:Uncharacterized protein n=1 Tax=Nocardia flavorosea TaxID=53429 RepID=A0A846YSW1_9NOCA|nr:hypothetical protein [Nocardia flavorosea]NKY60372.1 hypothetical protein [Nocardia flavorosea]
MSGYTFTVAGESGTITAEELVAAIKDVLGDELLLVPSGGTTGQVLTKTSGGYAWQTPA